MDLININTDGWVRIYCDKCGSENLYEPEYAKTITQCFGCIPEASVKEPQNDKDA